VTNCRKPPSVLIMVLLRVMSNKLSIIDLGLYTSVCSIKNSLLSHGVLYHKGRRADWLEAINLGMDNGKRYLWLCSTQSDSGVFKAEIEGIRPLMEYSWSEHV
jgi:hypothetical protein